MKSISCASCGSWALSYLFKFAWRDSRASRKRLAVFSLAIVLGVAALVSIGSLRVNLRDAVDAQARSLLGADLALYSRQPLTEEVETFVRSLGAETAREVAFNAMAVFPSSKGRTRLVQARALEDGYPFYGDFETEPIEARAALAAGTGAIVEEGLMVQFGLSRGDPLRLGEATFSIAGVLKKIPGESPAVTLLAPRVYVPFEALGDTGLLEEGSLARYRIYLKFPRGTDVEELVDDLRDRFQELRLGFDTVERRKRRLGRGVDNAAMYLNLAGFAALLLGSVGVASGIHAHMRTKIATVAVLRCLGASGRQAFVVYLIQGCALGVGGAILGALVGIAVQQGLAVAAAGRLPVEVDFSVSWAAVFGGVFAGSVVCLLVSTLPLLEVRGISPLRALRVDASVGRPSHDPWRTVVIGLLAAGLVVLSVNLAGSWRQGVAFATGIGAVFVLLGALAWGLMRMVRRMRWRQLPFAWRQGLANLHRPGNRTVLITVSLGLGVFLLLALFLARETLLGDLRFTGGDRRPNLAFFDIQDDQVVPVERLLIEGGAPFVDQVPIVTMRLTSLKGRTVAQVMRDPDSAIPGWTLRREYRSTFRGAVTDSEVLVAGRWVDRYDDPAGPIPVSLEEGLAEDLQLELGDRFVFDVQGVPMECEVASLRRVDWNRFEPNFFMVFPEGVLEAAPKFYVATTRTDDPEHSARLQQSLVNEFPNVSAIDLRLLLETIDGIFSRVEQVVRFLSIFTLGTGVLVLVSAVLTGRFQRAREAALLRTLGGTRSLVRRVLLVEYLALGLLAAAAGCLLALAGNAAVAWFIFDTQPRASWGAVTGAGVLAVGLTLAGGIIATQGLNARPPLETLREEG